MIISNYIDKQAISTDQIIKDFNAFLEMQEDLKLTKEQELEIRNLCKTHPIVNILCTAMLEIGYESF